MDGGECLFGTDDMSMKGGKYTEVA
jgi:hypothetical protein